VHYLPSMKRALLSLGQVLPIALVTLLLSAVSAGAAQFTAENTSVPEHHEHALLAATQSTTQEFTAGEGFGPVTCAAAALGCKDSFGRTVHISVNGCSYRFHATSGSGATYTGDWDVVCPAGKAIEWKITSGGAVVCTVSVGSQSGVGPMHFQNTTSGESTDLKVGFEAANLKSTTVGGFFSCGVSEGAHTEGVYTGASTLSAESTGGGPLDVLVAKDAEGIRFIAENTSVPEQHEHALLAATQSTTQEFTAGEGFGPVTCTAAALAGTSATGTDTELTLTPTYSGCKDSFGRTVHISVNGCSYRFHATSGSGATYTGDWDVVCAAGKAIEYKITSGGAVVCTVSVGSQSGVGPMHFQNTTSGESTDLQIGFEAANLKSTTVGGFFSCGVSEGAHTEGIYTGASTLSAESTGGGPLDVLVAKDAEGIRFIAENTSVPEQHEHALLAATQSTTQEFTAGEGFGPVTCTAAALAGTSATGTDTELTLTPTYSGCKDSFGRTVHISVNGCSYRFHATSGSGATYTGDWDVVCAAGKAIEYKITSGGAVVCTVSVGSQSGVGPMHFQNTTSGESTDLQIGFEAANLKSTTVGHFLNCGVSEGTHTEGTYTGASTLSAESTGGGPLDVLVAP
jgi:hypothetical protein